MLYFFRELMHASYISRARFKHLAHAAQALKGWRFSR